MNYQLPDQNSYGISEMLKKIREAAKRDNEIVGLQPPYGSFVVFV